MLQILLYHFWKISLQWIFSIKPSKINLVKHNICVQKRKPRNKIKKWKGDRERERERADQLLEHSWMSWWIFPNCYVADNKLKKKGTLLLCLFNFSSVVSEVEGREWEGEWRRRVAAEEAEAEEEVLSRRRHKREV